MAIRSMTGYCTKGLFQLCKIEQNEQSVEGVLIVVRDCLEGRNSLKRRSLALITLEKSVHTTNKKGTLK